jgi:hypothetical protein
VIVKDTYMLSSYLPLPQVLPPWENLPKNDSLQSRFHVFSRRSGWRG